MSWKERFRPASFRGVGFSIESADTSGGRRVVTHEYPGRSTPYTEDLGRSAREFSVEGFIVGADYDRQRERLVAACEADGPGELVHPYKGTRRVYCTSVSEREQISEQRIVRVSMQFVEAGTAGRPSKTAAPAAQVDRAALQTTQASEAQLVSDFSLTGMPEFVRSGALATLRDAANTVRTALDRVGQIRDEAVAAIEFVADNAEALVDAPGDMAGAITRMIDDVTGALSDAGDALDVGEDMRGLGDYNDTITGNTRTRDQQRRNRAAIQRHTRVAALSAASRASARVQWPSRGRAEKRRDDLLAWTDEEQLITDDSTLFAALQQQRVRVAEAVPPRDERLPQIRTMTLGQTEPALVTAYRLYTDPERGDAIARRNGVRHSGFMPGGEQLEYLNE
jgi:prophage DNA circulation protein